MEMRSRDVEMRSRDVEMRSKDVEMRSRDVEMRNRDVEMRNRDAEMRNRDPEMRSRDLEIGCCKRSLYNPCVSLYLCQLVVDILTLNKSRYLLPLAYRLGVHVLRRNTIDIAD